MSFFISAAYADTAAGAPPGGEYMQFVLLAQFIGLSMRLISMKRASRNRSICCPPNSSIVRGNGGL